MERLLDDLAPGVDFSGRLGQPVRLPDEGKDKEGSPRQSAAFVKPSPPSDPTQRAATVLPSDPMERRAFLSRIGAAERASPSRRQSYGESDGESSESYNEEEVAFVSTRAPKAEEGAGFEVCFRHAAENEESASPRPGSPSNSSFVEPASFIGNSSGFHLIPVLGKMQPADEGPQSSSNDKWKVANTVDSARNASLRPVFWTMPQCLTAPPISDRSEEDVVADCWPAPDLEAKLVDAYFSGPHRFYPILNETIFRRELDNVSKRDDSEAKMLALSVFALASRYIDDDRVLDPAVQDESKINTRGVRWFNACRRIGYRVMWPSPTLSHIQSMVLAIIYINGTPLAHTLGWALLGLVIRMLQSAGAHRKITADRLCFPVHVEESWRRVWWVTYMLDRESATSFGRPMAIQDVDFDTEPPREVDDNRLAMGRNKDGETPQQPSDQPSLLTGFTWGLKLDEILGRTLRTLYATSKAKADRGVFGKEWDKEMVREIDSLLNDWRVELPKHLTYNADEQSDEWLVQSTLLYSKYYYCQILVHRPFFAGPKTSSQLNFASLRIAKNAAQETVRMMWILHEKGLLSAGGASAVFRTFEAGCVLLLVGWGSKEKGIRPSGSLLTDIKRCLSIISAVEKQWVLAGRLGDLLRVLYSAITGDKSDDGSSLSEKPSEAATGDSNSNIAPLVYTLSAGKRKPDKNRPKNALPLSTQDLGVTPASDSTAHRSTSGSPSYAAPDVAESATGDARIQGAAHENGPIFADSSNGEEPQWLNNPFARPGSMNGNGGMDTSSFEGPLDGPSFLSTLLGTPGNLFGSQMTPTFGPDGQAYFTPGSAGIPPYATNGNEYGSRDGGSNMLGGQTMLQPPTSSYPNVGGDFMGSGGYSGPPLQGATGMNHSTSPHPPSQQQQGPSQPGAEQPFNDIYQIFQTFQQSSAWGGGDAANFHF